MKFLIIAALALVAIANAQPYRDYDGPYGGGSYGSGDDYGHEGYHGDRHGRHNSGYGTNILNKAHNSGHVVNDYDKTVHHHQSAEHNSGHLTEVNNRGHNSGAYGDGYGGESNYGRNWQNGYGY